MFEVMTGSWGSQLEQLQHHIRTSGNAKQRDVLVMYIFSNTDPQYLNNLKFFVHEGVHDGDGCEYIFVINRSADEEVRSQLLFRRIPTVRKSDMLLLTFQHEEVHLCFSSRSAVDVMAQLCTPSSAVLSARHESSRPRVSNRKLYHDTF